MLYLTASGSSDFIPSILFSQYICGTDRIGDQTWYERLTRLSWPLNEHDALTAHIPVPKILEGLQFFGLELGPLLVVGQVGVGEVAADQRIFIFRSGETDVVGVHVAVAFGCDELDPGDEVEVQVAMPVVGLDGDVFARDLRLFDPLGAILAGHLAAADHPHLFIVLRQFPEQFHRYVHVWPPGFSAWVRSNNSVIDLFPTLTFHRRHSNVTLSEAKGLPKLELEDSSSAFGTPQNDSIEMGHWTREGHLSPRAFLAGFQIGFQVHIQLNNFFRIAGLFDHKIDQERFNPCSHHTVVTRWTTRGG